MIDSIKNFVFFIIIVFIFILIGPFILIFGIPVIIIIKIKKAISLRRFLRQRSGSIYMVCSSRRNWHDFLINNVVPFLPDNIHAVWHNSMRWNEPSGIFKQLDYLHIYSVAKPYLVVVTRRTLLYKSLNLIFQDLKKQSRKSSTTQQECVRIIVQQVKDLQK